MKRFLFVFSPGVLETQCFFGTSPDHASPRNCSLHVFSCNKTRLYDDYPDEGGDGDADDEDGVVRTTMTTKK